MHISNPIDDILEEQFSIIYEGAILKAEQDFQSMIISKIEKIDLFEKCKFLFDEIKRINQEIENHQYSFYIYNYSFEDTVANQFTNRTFLLGVDERNELSEAIYIGRFHFLIVDLDSSLRKKVPAYTFQKFIKNNNCPYFETFPGGYNTTEKNWRKIRHWQSTNIERIITFEYLHLIQQIQKHCETILKPLDFISKEKIKIETLLTSTISDGKSIKKALLNLFIFKERDITILDNNLLAECFANYKKQVNDWNKVKPQFITPLIQKIQQNEFELLTTELTIFYTIYKVLDWFELVLNGQPLQEKVTTPDWNLLISKIYSDAIEIFQKLADEIDNYINKKANSKEEVKNFPFKKF